MEDITPHQAKKIIGKTLSDLGLPAYKLTAKTVSFMDLARCSRVFVTIHGWKPSPAWAKLKSISVDNGFYIQSDGLL